MFVSTSLFLHISQEPVLFSSSIRDNIAYGTLEPEAVTTEEIHQVARVANAYDFIQDFPKGFDTVVGEKGVLLSGKKQRGLPTFLCIYTFSFYNFNKLGSNSSTF